MLGHATCVSTRECPHSSHCFMLVEGNVATNLEKMSLTIHVQIPGHTFIKVTAKSDSTVCDLKQHLEEHTGIPWHLQVLKKNRTILANRLQLATYNIRDNDILKVEKF